MPRHPLVVFVDEAHQFLERTIDDDYASMRSDAVVLIAEEGRKYGLACVLATQRPRDVPADVLSRLGTVFVHRLTNYQAREADERACGDLDRGAARFQADLPELLRRHAQTSLATSILTLCSAGNEVVSGAHPRTI